MDAIKAITEEIEILETFLKNYKENPEDYVDYEICDDCVSIQFTPDEAIVDFIQSRITNLKSIKTLLTKENNNV